MEAVEPKKTLLHESTDDLTKKRVLFFKVEMMNGSHNYQLVIVDPYMTLNVEMSHATAVNFIKSFPKV